jgi:ferredoxin
MLMTSGYTAKIDSQNCAGCEACIDGCQFSAIIFPDDIAVIDEDDCYGCGVCVDMCPESAIELVLDPAKGTPLEIQKLMEQVNSGERAI